MKTVLFYFSGSGNTYAAAKKLAVLLGDSQVIHINKMKDVELNQYHRIGILVPVYALFVPKIVVSHLKDIHFLPEQRLFIVATYGASRGYAVEQVKSIIRENNQNKIQEFCVKMPGSYILEYGALPAFLQKKLIKSSHKKLAQIAECIQKETKTKEVKPNLLAVLFKESGIRMYEGYAAKGQLFYAGENCTGCGICSSICPVGNITCENGAVSWGNQCSQCMACIQWCPNHAVCHPALKEGRKRYHHPEVNIIQDITLRT